VGPCVCRAGCAPLVLRASTPQRVSRSRRLRKQLFNESNGLRKCITVWVASHAEWFVGHDSLMTPHDEWTPRTAGQVFLTPSAYADEDRFYSACRYLRSNAPLHWVESPQDPLAETAPAVVDAYPFWAVTRHSDIMTIETQPDRFVNAPRPTLGEKAADDRRVAQGDMLRTLIHMDAPDHKVYRALTDKWFHPSALKQLEPRMAALARRTVDDMMSRGASCDFARDVAVHYPLSVILSILGLPDEDYPRMLRLTQELFGAADEDLARGRSMEDLLEVIADFFAYFGALTAARRAQPTDDLASVIANATIDGRPLGDMETISYYVIIATAGHDTTSSSIAGGLLALLQHPDQLALLREDPSLLSSAVEEMIRWTTPVKHFMRTATQDTEVGGTLIKEGQSVLLSYPSGNRDEAVFDHPDRFDITRSPNKHLAFGFGVHFCLGAQLARMEARALFAELLSRLDSIELAGDPAWMQTLFVGGLKRLPVQYSLRPH
jgi:cytochrome P450